MRVLCDQNVDQKYIDALLAADDIEVGTVRERLDARATDPDVVDYAAANAWVVFTCDDDFFELASECGVIYYSQFNAPAVGDVRAALQTIDDAYADHSEIVEVVPGCGSEHGPRGRTRPRRRPGTLDSTYVQRSIDSR